MENNTENDAENNEFDEIENLKQAIMHLVQAGSFFTNAGFRGTGFEIMKFANSAMLKHNEITGEAKLQKEKLKTEEYDAILADIFNA